MITNHGIGLVKEAVDLSVANADLMDRSEVEAQLGNRLLRASRQQPKDPKDMAVKGGVPGALAGALFSLPSALYNRSVLTLGGGTLLGGALGAGLGFLSGKAHNADIKFAKDRVGRFKDFPSYRSRLYYDAVDDAMRERAYDAHYKALARNERDKEFHQRVYGSQMLRH